MTSTESAKRPYVSAVRSTRQAETRRRILDAVLVLLARAPADLQVAEVAREAGVAAATVYKHFPDRVALMDAAQEHLGERLGRAPAPESVADARRQAPERVRWLRRHETAVRAAAACGPFLRALTRRRRGVAERVLGPVTAHLGPAEANAVRGLLLQLSDPRTFLALVDEWQAEDEAIAGAVGWAVGALLDELERGGGPR